MMDTYLQEGGSAVRIDAESINYGLMSIGNTAAINLARKSNLSLTLGEKCIKNSTSMHYFEPFRRDRLTIGIRTLTMMSGYLNTKFAAKRSLVYEASQNSPCQDVPERDATPPVN